MVGLVDPRAESPGESWLRLRMIDAGFPAPVPQVVVSDGSTEYRIDLAFLDRLPGRARRLALEYDSDRWHGTARQQAADESRRRDLRRMGWEVMSVRRWQVWGPEQSLEAAVGDILGIRLGSRDSGDQLRPTKGDTLSRRARRSATRCPHGPDDQGGGGGWGRKEGGGKEGDYLSMSPTTKNMLPRMATMSATTWLVRIWGSTAMLLKDAERSFMRQGVLSPRDTR